MSHSTAEKSLPFNLDLVFRRGLGRSLLVYLTVAFFVPITGVSVIGYHLLRHHLEQEVRTTVSMFADIQRLKIQHLADRTAAAEKTGAPETDPDDWAEKIDPLMNMPSDTGNGYHTYLVGPDLNPITGTAGARRSGDPVADTALIRSWQENRSGTVERPVPSLYSGPDGRQVMGTYRNIHLTSGEYALIIEADAEAAFRSASLIRDLIIAAMVLAGLCILIVSAAMARKIMVPLREMGANIVLAQEGRSDRVVHIPGSREFEALGAGIERMIKRLETVQSENDIQTRIMDGLARLHRLIVGEQGVRSLSVNTLEFICGFLNLSYANAFTVKKKGGLTCTGRWPGRQADDLPRIDRLAGGRVDQTTINADIAAFRMPPVGDVVPVASIDQANLLVVPIVLKQKILGFLELETSMVFCRFDQRFMRIASELIAVAMNAALIRQQESSLQKQNREQAKKLAIRESALEDSARELQFQRQIVHDSEKKLKIKQFELEAANAQMAKNASDLEAHMHILEKQKVDMQKQNAALEKAHWELAEKAHQLEISSRYKTEFMANMSHELRTPLNSTLLLSRLLLENKENTLTPKQQEFAKTIHSAGEDLLNLINEILDLAKVESGKMEVDLAPINVRTMANAMRVGFAPLAEQKGVRFVIHVAPDVPDKLFTDRKRIEQIVKNFLSNAFKFTTEGTIRLELAVTRDRVICRGAGSEDGAGCLSIGVVDTGIGIPRSKHEMVFEAFQQVDGSTRRKYGGTGLGLSISRELAHLLGGEITLESEGGRGSRFTLHLPIFPLPEQEPALIQPRRSPPRSHRNATPIPPVKTIDEPTGADLVPDDRNRLTPGDSSILIIASDKRVNETVKGYAYGQGYKILIAEQFQTGLHFADYYLPTAIFAHLRPSVPIIRQIKANPISRHIPVFTLSPDDNDRAAAVYGAAGHIREPIAPNRMDAVFQKLERLRTSTDRKVLAVGWDAATIFTNALGAYPVRIEAAASLEAAEKKWASGDIDTVILSATMDATQQQQSIHNMQPGPGSILRYDDGHDKHRSTEKNTLSDGLTLQTIHTPDQLLQAMVGRLHLTPEAMDDKHRDRLLHLDGKRSVFTNRNVLLVDDDMRTVFAVTSVLEDQGVKVIAGKTGKESLDKLNAIPDIDLILMDVMITEVDGYQAIRRIRDNEGFRTLPIIALTAKAMQGDRAKCIAAGADDYLAKPVDTGKLTSMLKIWFDPQLADPETRPS